jgi:hypothetical protein
MPAALATVAVEVYVPVELANTELAVPLVVTDLRVVSTEAAPAPSGQSNFVSGYPNVAIRCYDFHCCFRVVGSNSYYSLIILKYIVSFGPNNYVVIRLPVKNDAAS